jgi:hypothetical protein
MAMLPGPYYQGHKGKIWPTVVFFLALLVFYGLAATGYPPARFLVGLLDRFGPILRWALMILVLYAIFRPRPN